MKNLKRLCLLTVFLFTCAILYKQFKFIIGYQQTMVQSDIDYPRPDATPGLMFVDSTDKVELSPLSVCSVESAARANPEKPIYYFIRGFNGNLSDYPDQYMIFQTLQSMKNVILLPLKLKTLFENTPLDDWYQKVDPDLETYWIHVLSDACRLALLWKYGGIYLDTDIISLKPLRFTNFICAQQENLANGAALGLSRHHNFTQDCMEDYVKNYEGTIWGQQGPLLMSRVLRRWCKTEDLDEFIDAKCKDISYLPSKFFYPIPYTDWEKYFEHWTLDNIKATFSDTYGAHIWNFLSSGKQDNMNDGSRGLLEYFFREYCPRTYNTFYTNQ
ncbi:lactosylceramide 4-alpha-galactosyltransferase-like [Heptranchias perlo]|uniref:lactosylceramide 4-alpha-galactosyltransferase-like n=1 Tax=Heptranchias perlo TaxID=212740 RepID=UPI00355A7CBA